MYTPSGTLCFVRNNANDPRTAIREYSAADVAGTHRIHSIFFFDIHGNRSDYSRSDLDTLGVPPSISVFDASTQTANLSLKAIDIKQAIHTNSTFTYPFTITNNASELSEQITLNIYSQGVAYSAFFFNQR
jgi:hypothetical protein